MKWNVIGALVVSVGLCSQSQGFELLDRMLGSGCGCAVECGQSCCEKPCGAAADPGCGCATACDPGCGCATACESCCQPACCQPR